MDRLNNIKKAISVSSIEEIKKKLTENQIDFFHDLEAFSKRELTITDADMGIDRKLLYLWKSKELLPFTSKKTSKKTWGRFSFIEICWLKMLVECRKVGIGMEKLKELKQFFFPPDFIDVFFSVPITDKTYFNEEIEKNAKNIGLLKNDKVQLTPNFRKILEEIQFSLFFCLLYATIISRRNYIFYLDGNGNHNVFDLSELKYDPLTSVVNVYELLENNTLVFINIKKIIADITGTHEIFETNERIGGHFSENSIQFLRKIFKEEGVIEITIRLNEKNRPIITLKKNVTIENFEKKIRELQKKGTFCDVKVKTRDGKIQYFEHVELIKL
jgi:hypothetical protein